MALLDLYIDKTRLCDRLLLRNGAVPSEEYYGIVSLSIKAPGSQEFKTIGIEEDWCSKTILYDDLGIGCYNSGSTQCNPDIPDGVYEIKYAIDGEEALYYHLRTCKLWNSYLMQTCTLFNSKCSSNPNKYKEAVANLWEIRNMILDAEIMAEDCLEPNSALIMYEHIKEKLNTNDCMC